MDVSKQVFIIQAVGFTKIIQIGCHYSVVKLSEIVLYNRLDWYTFIYSINLLCLDICNCSEIGKLALSKI